MGRKKVMYSSDSDNFLRRLVNQSFVSYFEIAHKRTNAAIKQLNESLHINEHRNNQDNIFTCSFLFLHMD